jgi:chloride channel protein, CIC family
VPSHRADGVSLVIAMVDQAPPADSHQGHHFPGHARVKSRHYLRSLIARAHGVVHGNEFEYAWLIILSIVIGGLGALGNLGFRALIDLSSWILRGVEWRTLGILRGGIFLVLIPLVLCTGGLVLSVLEYFFPGDVLGYGFPNFLAMLHLGGAKIKGRLILLEAAGAALSLGAGASVGREGPIAQIGGSIGATIGQLVRLSTERSKVLMACGAGAGIATTFNAPIGGLLFAQEIVLLGETELANLTLLIIATTSGVITSGVITGNEAVFYVQPFVLESYRELITYALMGVAMGLLSVGYIRLFYSAAEFFKRMKVSPFAKLLIGLTVVGLIAIPLPDNLSDGYPVINEALAGRLPIERMMLLSVAKISASSVSLGCGAPGGVFGPIFFIGAMTGGSFRRLSAGMFPHLTGPRGSYALVGLGAFLAGTTHAPLTAVFLLFEMTREYQITLPALLSCVLSLVVARSLEPESIDTYELAREGKTLHIGKERRVLTEIPVSMVMSKEPVALFHTDDLAEVVRVSGETAQSTIPVINREAELVGIVIRRDVIELLASGNSLETPGSVCDLARQHPPAVTPESNLDEALQRLQAEGLEELPVVEGPTCRLVGLISRRAIALAVSHATVSLEALAGPDTGIFWSSDYRIARIRVPAPSADKTLRELNLRTRFGVTILAIQSSSSPASGFAPVDPDQILKQGDLLVAAGRPAGVRAFERYLNGSSEEPC